MRIRRPFASSFCILFQLYIYKLSRGAGTETEENICGLPRDGSCHWFARVNFAGVFWWLSMNVWCLLIMKVEPKTGHIQIPNAQQTGV